MIETGTTATIPGMQIGAPEILAFDPGSFQATAFVLMLIGFVMGYAVHKYAPRIKARLFPSP